MRNKWTCRMLALLMIGASLLAVAAQEKDWVKATTRDGAISLMVPPGYMVQDDKDPKWLETYEKIKQDNPALAKSIGSTPVNQNQTLMMFDLNDSPADGVLDTFNVLSQKNPGITDRDLDAVGKEVAKTLPAKGGKFQHKVVKLSFGKAVAYWATVEIKMPSGAMQEMDMLGYLFLKGDKMHVISFATGTGQLKEKRPLFDKMMNTLKA